MGAYTAAHGWVPPMLNISFAKLMRGGSQQVLAQQMGLGIGQSHGILQLISESERATGLVETGSGPHATSQSLVDQPTVGEEIDGGIRGFNTHAA